MTTYSYIISTNHGGPGNDGAAAAATDATDATDATAGAAADAAESTSASAQESEMLKDLEQRMPPPPPPPLLLLLLRLRQLLLPQLEVLRGEHRDETGAASAVETARSASSEGSDSTGNGDSADQGQNSEETPAEATSEPPAPEQIKLLRLRKRRGKGNQKDQKPADLPSSMKNLVSCRRCGLIKTADQFWSDGMREEDEFAFIGCDNCAEVFRSLDYDDEQQMFKDTTTPHYHGSIAMIHPSHSWVASWQGINNLRPGMYAVEAEDELPAKFAGFLTRKYPLSTARFTRSR